MTKNQTNPNGFTLIELLVVIAIVAILAAVSIIGYQQFIVKARESRANTELQVIVRQIELAYYNHAYHGNDGSTFTVSYTPPTIKFSLKDANGNLTHVNATQRIALAINEAIYQSSGNISTIAQPWTNLTPLSEASDQLIAQSMKSLNLGNQEAILFINLVSNELTIIYYTNGTSLEWTNVGIKLP
jgi:prepilin-type N-terminal cleavage/methylation domain-containing protein